MSLPVIIEPPARAELDSAYEWYETSRIGLGEEYLTSVSETIARIQERPEMYAAIYKAVRRADVRRFPYAVYYRVEPSRIRVLAVYHGSRDPAGWRRRA